MMDNKYLNYGGVFIAVLVGVAIAHYWPDQKEYAGGLIGIGLGWLAKHLSN